MTARITRPAKTAMQSGRANSTDWLLEFEPAGRKSQDALMGWTGSGDTEQQVRLFFASRDEAVAYCRRRGIAYAVAEPHDRALKPKSYAANFRWDRAQ